MTDAQHPIINLDQLDPQPFPVELGPKGGAADRFAPLFTRIGPLIGTKGLGCSLTVLSPGKRAFPYHNHRVNEELFIILSGVGTLRRGTEQYPLRAGDLIACPPGGPETAHQIINDGEGELRYLAVSTMQSPDLVEYPDSGKIGFSHVPSGFRMITTPAAAVDYWQDE